MLEVFSGIEKDNFQAIVIEKKEDLWSGFRAFMMKDAAVSDVVGSDEKKEAEASA